MPPKKTWVKQIKADLKKQWLSLSDAKREALKRQAWKTIVQIMIKKHRQQCIGSGTNQDKTLYNQTK